ncbi:MAG: hypothetical protein DRN06_09060, partial [Thermoprotei archaeon]
MKVGEVDVVLCTYNSNKPYFRRCLEAIKREVPVRRLIVVDRFSKDGTLKTVKSVFPDAVVIRSEANLARARKLGIEAVETKYFLFVDDDVELSKGWFEAVTEYVDSRTGGIHGHAVPVCGPLKRWFRWVRGVWEP